MSFEPFFYISKTVTFRKNDDESGSTLKQQNGDSNTTYPETRKLYVHHVCPDVPSLLNSL